MKKKEKKKKEEAVAAETWQREASNFEVGDRETETPPERSRLQSNSDDAIACSCIRRHLIALALSCQRHYISRLADLFLSPEQRGPLCTFLLPLRCWTEPMRTFRVQQHEEGTGSLELARTNFARNIRRC